MSARKFVMNRWFFPALLLPILFVSGWAQSPGLFSLSGVVSDQNDALVSDATLTLKGGQPSRQFTIKTDAGGAFRFEKIAPGEYEITAMREGFSRTTITVSVGARSLTGIKLVLPIAEVQQEIVVTSSTAQPNTDADGSLNVVTLDRTALDQLPSLDQDYIATLSQFLDNGAVGSGGATLIVDGMEAVKAGVSPSAIQEVKINNNPYS